MLRTFVGSFTRAGGAAPPRDRLERGLDGLGTVSLLEQGPLRVAYTGPPPPAAEPDAPVCVLDGTLYDAVGLDLPAAEGPEAEAFLAREFARHGTEMLGLLRGDFALVLYDPPTGRALIARDQMGGRLVLWHGSGAATVFATEFRPLLGALSTTPPPDRVSVSHWVAVSGLPGDRTLFEGVHRVPAGSALALDVAPRALRYWEPRYEQPLPGERGEHAARMRSAIERAVRRRIDPDGGSAVMLSGGLDSSAVAAVATRLVAPGVPLPAYSAVFPGHPTVDESELIEHLTSELGIASTTACVHRGSVLAGALDYLDTWGVPPVSPNLFFWRPLLERAGQDGVRSMLDGEGGDELFGYSIHLVSDRLRRGRLGEALQLGRSTPGFRPSRKAYSRLLSTRGLKGLLPHGLHAPIRRMRGAGRYAPAHLRPEAAALYIESDDSHDWKLAAGPRWYAYLLGRVAQGMGANLAYDHVRRRAARSGLEARHPLVDVDVIEAVLRTPPELAFDPRHSRPILRESMEGVLPDRLRLRPEKSTFDAVFHQALGGVDLPALRALLDRPGAEVHAYVDPAAVSELMRGPPTWDLMWWAMAVWRLATAECWLVSQGGPGSVERLLPGSLAEPSVELISSLPRPAVSGGAG